MKSGFSQSSRTTWRERAAPIVANIVRDNGFSDPKALRAALSKSYPFGTRTGYPYRVWLTEIRRQIGGMRPAKPDPAQLKLF